MTTQITDISKYYKLTTAIENVRKKNWAAGSKQQISSLELIFYYTEDPELIKALQKVTNLLKTTKKPRTSKTTKSRSRDKETSDGSQLLPLSPLSPLQALPQLQPLKPLQPLQPLKQLKPLTQSQDVLPQISPQVSPQVLPQILPQILPRMIAAKFQTVSYPPILTKIIDEPIVNVYDWYNECAAQKLKPVTTLSVKIDDSGLITIYNDGPGLPNKLHPEANVYVVELAFMQLFQGSNNREDTTGDAGGTNGLGVKLTSIFSTYSKITNCDGIYNYVQCTKDAMKSISPPVIEKYNPLVHNLGTTIEFMPDYEFFGYKRAADVVPLLRDLTLSRLVLAASYGNYRAGVIGGRIAPIRVIFNGCAIPNFTMDQIAGIVANSAISANCQKLTLNVPNAITGKNPMEIIAIIADEPVAMNQLSNINAVVCRGGSHFEYLVETIRPQVAEVVKKTTKETRFQTQLLTRYLFVLMNLTVESPQWEGQRKDTFKMPDKYFTCYPIPEKFIRDMAKAVKDVIVDAVLSKNKKTTDKIPDLDRTKYTPAKEAGKRGRRKCFLIIVEGDSAKDPTEKGIKENPNLGSEYYGIATTGGVIINVRKETEEKTTLRGSKMIVKSEKFKNNKFINQFRKILGLNEQYKYKPGTPTYEAEMNSLDYGAGVIIFVDQDFDGHNIGGLIINYFATMFPELLKNGYVYKAMTPIIRLYPSAVDKVGKSGRSKTGDQNENSFKVLSFYTEVEYDEWRAKNKFDDKYIEDNYIINYYKGLASHSDIENKDMYSKIHTKFYRISYREDSEMIEIFYGRDTDERKLVLGTKPKQLEICKLEEFEKTRSISCDDYLTYFVEPYQRDNILRKLDNVIDGFNKTARMVYDGATKYFTTRAAAMTIKGTKIDRLAGAIAQTEHYHHGNVSMEDLIKGRAFLAPGGNQIPFLLPVGSLGTRACGGKSAGASRYTSVQFNWDVNHLMFPREFYNLLEFNFEDGERCEPRYFVPIIPQIMESRHLPGTGWKLRIFGRDVYDVIAASRKYISADGACEIAELKMNTRGWYGDIRVGDKPRSFGKCTYDEKTGRIYIYELPYRVWTNDYILKLSKLAEDNPKLIKDIDTNGKKNIGDAIDIQVELQPGAFNEIMTKYKSEYIHPVYHFLGLYASMSANINLINPADNSVLEFKEYREIFKYWYPVCKKMYGLRIEREKIILNMKITHLKNLLHYLSNETNIRGMPENEADALLKQIGYPKIDTAIMNKPEFIPNDKLMEEFYGSGASYAYIYDSTDRMKTREGKLKRQAEHDKYVLELERLNAVIETFPGQKLWLEEIDALEKTITRGFETNWKYHNVGKMEYA